MLDLKKLGDSSSLGTPEDEAPEAALAAPQAPPAPVGEATAETGGQAPERPRKLALGKLKLAATPESEVEAPPLVPDEEPEPAPADVASVDPDIADIAGIIEPKGLMTEAEVSPVTPAASPAVSQEPLDGPMNVEGAPKADASPAPVGVATADVAGATDKPKTPEEEEEEARRAAAAPFAQLIASLPNTVEGLALARTLETALLAERARKEGASRQQAADLARGRSGGGGSGRSIFGGGSKAPSPGLLDAMKRFRVGGRVPTLDVTRDRIYAVKAGQVAEAGNAIERAGGELAAKVGAFNAAFLGSNSYARIRDIANGRGMSVDDYMADLNARPDAPANKEGRAAAMSALSEPGVRAAWGEVDAGRESLARATENGRREYELTASNFQDKPEAHALGEGLAEKARTAIDGIPQPVFEDPAKDGKLKEKLEELKEQMEEMVRKLIETFKSVFGRG